MNISVVRHMLSVDSVSYPVATDAEMTVQLQFSNVISGSVTQRPF